MSRYNWYDLAKDGKVIGYGGSLGMSDFLNDELIMNYVFIFLHKIDTETTLDEFELIWTHHESGFNDGAGSRGTGIAHFSSIPPMISKEVLIFENVIFTRKVI